VQKKRLLVDLFFSVGNRRKPQGWITWLIPPFAASIACWVVYAALFAIIDPWELAAIFLCGMLTLVFLLIGGTPNSDPHKPTIWDWILSAASLGAGIFFFINSEALVSRIPMFDPLSGWEIASGTILFLTTLEAVRRTTGVGLTLIVLFFIAYNFLGHHLTGTFRHGYIPYLHFLELTVFTTDGILGVPVRVAATYAFLFVMFGTFLGRAGGSEFFFNLAAIVSGHRPGGPAKIAVISSGLYGMLSGSPTSDVVTTGSVTIPMMKRVGYPAPLAGAFEVAASTGGSLLPPVMGSAAFIMAEYTGIDYNQIVVAAIIPATLYYLSVYAQVHLRSLKLGLKGMPQDQLPKLGNTFKMGGVFLFPLLSLITALLMGYSPNMVAVFGVVSVIAVSLFRRATRLGPKIIYETLVETTTRMVAITGACAAAGLVIGGITMTGLGMKFAALVTVITHGHLFFSLIVAAALTIILGMGMPTPSAYILAAALVGPLLTKELGIPVMAAHFMLLYFAVMSAITPPVAVAAYAAAPIADANPLHIAVLAVRLALGAFVVPLAFVYNQELLMVGTWLNIIIAFFCTGAGLIFLAIAVEGFIQERVSWWGRLMIAAAGICMIVPGTATLVAGVVLAALALVLHRSFNKRQEASAS